MTTLTIITDTEHRLGAAIDGDQVLVPEGTLVDLIGWELKPEGLCRGDVCVPVRDSRIAVGDSIDLAAVTEALGAPVVVDAVERLIAIGQAAIDRRQPHDVGTAAPFTLPDLDGVDRTLAEWRGRKKLLVAFASW